MTVRRTSGERRADVAPSVELVAGAPGSPTRTERDRVYDDMLRCGDLPSGWISQRARMWGISKQTVSDEVAECRKALDAERQLEGCQVAAHQLTMAAIKCADRIDALSVADLERDTDAERTGDEMAALIEARAKGVESRAKTIKMVADIKLRAAASLLSIHRKPAVLATPTAAEQSDPNKLLKE